MLLAKRVLIVEDEPMVAMDLADAVEATGGQVVGPFATVRETLQTLDEQSVAVAILDARLQDGDVTPVALRLANAGVPLVVHSGTGLPAEVVAQRPDLPVLLKPVAAERVVERLLVEMQRVSTRIF